MNKKVLSVKDGFKMFFKFVILVNLQFIKKLMMFMKKY